MKTHHRYLLLGAFVLLAALVFVPWQARRVAEARHVQQGEAFTTLHATNCGFIPAASLPSDVLADALRKGMVARQRESEPSTIQVEGLARHVGAFLSFHPEASPSAYPDDADNHGAAGIHVSYCDGHVEWLPTRGFLYQYELDSDDGRTGIPLPPGVGSP